MEPFVPDEAELAAVAFLARYREPSTPTVTICATCSNGLPTTAFRCSKRPVPI